jgi:hypothetical protein
METPELYLLLIFLYQQSTSQSLETSSFVIENSHSFRGTIIKMGKRVGEVVTMNPFDILRGAAAERLSRNIIVSIKSGNSSNIHLVVMIKMQHIVGMKRYVDILPSHQIYNKTDEDLEVQLTGEGFTHTYTCLPGKRTPICYDKHWDMALKLRPSSEWNWSLPFSLDIRV